MATHDPRLLPGCDRVVALRDGRVIFDGPAADFLVRPRTTRRTRGGLRAQRRGSPWARRRELPARPAPGPLRRAAGACHGGHAPRRGHPVARGGRGHPRRTGRARAARHGRPGPPRMVGHPAGAAAATHVAGRRGGPGHRPDGRPRQRRGSRPRPAHAPGAGAAPAHAARPGGGRRAGAPDPRHRAHEPPGLRAGRPHPPGRRARAAAPPARSPGLRQRRRHGPGAPDGGRLAGHRRGASAPRPGAADACRTPGGRAGASPRRAGDGLPSWRARGLAMDARGFDSGLVRSRFRPVRAGRSTSSSSPSPSPRYSSSWWSSRRAESRGPGPAGADVSFGPWKSPTSRRSGRSPPTSPCPMRTARCTTCSTSTATGRSSYFYPADDTPGCTMEACGFRDANVVIAEQGATVWGISPQGVKSKAAFRDKFDLSFPLLADVGHRVAETYGCWVERTNYGKTIWASRAAPSSSTRMVASRRCGSRSSPKAMPRTYSPRSKRPRRGAPPDPAHDRDDGSSHPAAHGPTRAGDGHRGPPR